MSYFNTTLKRNSKLDLSRADLLKLVSMLEGELQAREIAIAVFKSEQIKRLLNPPKLPHTLCGFKPVKNLNSYSSNSALDLNPEQTIKYSADPLSALSRDSFAVYEPTLDHTTTLALFNLKIYQLENFINNQKVLRNKLCEQLKTLEERYEKILSDFEQERIKNNDLEAQFEEYDRIKLEEEIKSLTQSIEENKAREKQIILSLLSERKNLIIKLIEERHQNEELRLILTSEKGRIAEMVEGLEDESKRSLQMEAELEKYLTDFDQERNIFKVQLQQSECKNVELCKEIEQLKSTVDTLQKQLLSCSGKVGEGLIETKWDIGEGVRSSIVTMPASTKVHSLSSVSAVSHPKASVAQPVTKSIPSTNTILPPPSIPVPQPKQQPTATATMKKATTATSTPVTCSQSTTADTTSVITDSIINLNESADSIKSAEATKIDNSVKQNIMFYENSASQGKVSVSTAPSTISTTSTIRKSSVGARVPPPVPPKSSIVASIKPVLPSQAILQQSKLKETNLLGKTNNNNNNSASQSKSGVNSALSTASANISKS